MLFVVEISLKKRRSEVLKVVSFLILYD